MAIVRAIEPVAVRDPDTIDPKGNAPAVMVTIDPARTYRDSDPLVKAYPWAFTSDVEDTSAEPGRKRSVRRQNTSDAE